MKTVVITGSSSRGGFKITKSSITAQCAVLMSGSLPKDVHLAVSTIGNKNSNVKDKSCPYHVMRSSQLENLWQHSFDTFEWLTSGKFLTVF